MAGVRVHFIFSKDLLDRVDAVRGGLSRGAWVRELVERELSERPGEVILEPIVAPREYPMSRSELFRRASRR